jgi:hypothetical protein
MSFMSSPKTIKAYGVPESETEIQAVARIAYQFADAMLIARKKKR